MAAMAGDAPGTVLLYSHSWLPGQVDGVAIRMMAHAKELARRGSKVTVMTPDFIVKGFAEEPVKFQHVEGVQEHIALETQLTPMYLKNMCLRFSVANVRSIVAVIRRVKPDVVHATQEASIQLIALACLWCDVPLVVSFHTDVRTIAAIDEGFSRVGGSIGRVHAKMGVFCVYWGYLNWAMAGALFFCVSNQAKRILRDALVSESRVAPKRWGPMVDREVFRIDLPADRVAEERRRLTFGIRGAFLLVYAGRVTAEKDIQFLVDALARAPANVVLALVGAGSLTDSLQALHGAERRLHCTGVAIGREELAVAMRAADCCVSASAMETIGLTAMESLSCGTPFLAANAQGFAEHLEHGKNARLFTPLDEDSFDRELAEVMKAPAKGQSSREQLRESMAYASLDACTDTAVEAYLLARRPSMRPLRLASAVAFSFLNWLIQGIGQM